MQGTVKDPTGAVMVAVTVTLANPVSGLRRETTTDQTGKYVFRNLPPNPYHVAAAAQGFQTLAQDVDVRSAIPINLDLNLQLAGTTQASTTSPWRLSVAICPRKLGSAGAALLLR